MTSQGYCNSMDCDFSLTGDLHLPDGRTLPFSRLWEMVRGIRQHTPAHASLLLPQAEHPAFPTIPQEHLDLHPQINRQLLLAACRAEEEEHTTPSPSHRHHPRHASMELQLNSTCPELMENSSKPPLVKGRENQRIFFPRDQKNTRCILCFILI